tara:strand:+ start:349 stop:1437 length:1089 start_codon:yes stop_codon:yes gene_type:complete
MHYQNERNYGCRVSDDWEYRGNKVAIIENELIRVVVLVDKGADIYSFVHKPSDTDYMWRSTWGVRDTTKFLPTTGDNSWGDTYEGGWQSCAPTAGNKRKDYQGAPMGQHSEMSTMPWDSQILEDKPEKCSIKFSVRTYRTPFFMEKTLTLTKNSPFLDIDYKLTNESMGDSDCVWLEHIVFGDPFLSEKCRLDLPKAKIFNWSDITLKGLPDNRLSPQKEGEWPYAEGPNGKVDMRKIPPKSAKLQDLAMFHQLSEGWYALTNTETRIGIGMLFPKDVFKYVWNWQVFGGGSGFPWYGRHYNEGLELCTSLPDGDTLPNSSEETSAVKLKSGESIIANLKAITYESKTGVKEIKDDGTVINL